MKNSSSTFIIAVSILIGVIIFSTAFKNRNKPSDVINVTGLGSKDFVSDLIVWNGSFTKSSTDLKTAYSELNKDRETIKNYLLSKGIQEKEIVFSAVDIIKEYNDTYDKDGNKTSVFSAYKLTQNIQIESKEVDKVENISRQVTDLIDAGVEFYSQSPEYYYTKLAELKIDLIASATQDAYVRAEKIAENSGGKLGKLKNATMGVFQIIAQNSSEDFSWGGTFNTSAKNKTATITMKLQYESD